MPHTARNGRARLASEAQSLEESLRQTRQEYELFAGRISRDLHTVLRNICGFADAMEHHCGPALDDRARHFLHRMQENAARGAGLIEALRAYDEMASCRLEPVPVDSVRLLERAREALSHQAPLPPLEWRIGGDLPAVRGDARLLERMLVQLLSNAIRFRRPGVPLVIEVTGTVRGELLELRVADNGIGLDPADAHRLFQPFERLEAGAAADGAGMGLATVRRIVERHGGTVSADGVPGAGAVFRLTLPLATTAAAVPTATAAAGNDTAAARSLRVLLIDDDPLVLAALRAMLERMGHKVTSAAGGLHGLQSFSHALRHLAFDVVLTDWSMPQVGGGRVVEAVKKISPATPVVVVTGRPPVGDDAQALAKVDRVLTKPLRLAGLRSALQQLVPIPSA